MSIGWGKIWHTDKYTQKGAVIMKKFCCVLVLLFVCLPGPVMAYNYFQEILGEAVLQEDGILHVVGIDLPDGSQDEIFLYIDEAEIFNLRTGFAIGPYDIREGDTVRVIYESDRALEVYVHAGEADAADFMVVVSDNIWYSDVGCAFVTIDGKYRITLSEETLLLDSRGYEISYDEIAPGLEMFVWAAFVTASFPGQVIPDKVVLR